jgi:hypothetical protein
MNGKWLLGGMTMLAMLAACAPGSSDPGVRDFPVRPGDTWQVEVTFNGSTQSYAVQSAGEARAIPEADGMFGMPLKSQPGFGGNAFYFPNSRVFSIGVYYSANEVS